MQKQVRVQRHMNYVASFYSIHKIKVFVSKAQTVYLRSNISDDGEASRGCNGKRSPISHKRQFKRNEAGESENGAGEEKKSAKSKS